MAKRKKIVKKRTKVFIPVESDKDILRCKKRLWTKFKSAQKRRKIEVAITFEEYAEMVSSRCRYCGVASSNTLRYYGMLYKYNGLDRIDSNGIYEMDNVVACCSFCNSLKGPMKSGTWEHFINSVVQNFEGKPPFNWDETDADRPRKSMWYKGKF